LSHSGAPMIVNDYVHSPVISHDYDRIITAEGLRAMVAAPVIVRETVRGVIYGASRDAVPFGDRVVQCVLDAARDLEQILAVEGEVGRWLAWLDARSADQTESATPQWGQVREAYTELRILAKEIADPSVRERFEEVCRKLSDARPNGLHVKPAPKLSLRETDVLACAALGWTNSEIANELGVRRETVKSYLASAMHKLRTHSRLEAVVTARRFGLLP
jgi:DNA-binding CsgD family transcriptional regulator